MFTWIGSKFTGVLDTYVLGVVTSLMTALTPLALTAMTLWVALYGWAVIRNEVPESVATFLWKVFKIGLVLAFALQSSLYIDSVSTATDALATGVASTFLPATTDPATVTTPYALLDTFNDKASQLVVDLMREAGITRLDLVLAAIACSIGNVIFLCIALFVVTLSKMFLTFVIAIGPLFVLSLAFRPTARFFDSWLSMVLNAVVLTWFVFFALGISIYMGQAMVKAALDSGGFDGPNLNAVGESLRYCIVMVLMGIICFQAPSLASALTGGAAVHQGVQMIRNSTMVAGVWSRANARSAANGLTGGGVIRAGAGAPYAFGHAVGSASRAGSAIRGVSANVRTAAYKLAALRGRS